jgi:hypothetical protein
MLPDQRVHQLGGRLTGAFRRSAGLLLPASGDGEIIIAPDWTSDPFDDAPSARVCVWGRPAPSIAHPKAKAVTEAVARTRALHAVRSRPPAGYRVAGVHLVPPAVVRTGMTGTLARTIRAGAAVELHAEPGVHRVIDEIFDEAGARGPLGFVTGGALVPIGTDLILRASADGDALANAAALDALRGVQMVPDLRARGEAGGAAWTTESRITGRRPATLRRDVAGEVVDWCAQLPNDATPPTAPYEELDELTSAFPTLLALWRDLADKLGDASPPRSVHRHGDLWTGNLLVADGHLNGVVDWASWHPRGMPGTDILHLYAHAMYPGASSAALWTAAPWRNAEFVELTQSYWHVLGIRPTAEMLDAVALAWWIGRTAATVRSEPGLAYDQRWTNDNVNAIAESFE